MLLEVGTKAPDFTLPDEDGNLHTLSQYLGKRVILYFYPKDDTPGCTAQACGFSERLPQISDKGAIVLGISADSIASHSKFKDKYHLNFTLLSDESHQAIELYGVWQEKKNYGKTYMGIVRTTYLIDEKGIVTDVIAKVVAKNNPEQMLEKL